MSTISNEINISGKGLMRGLECNVALLPSEDKGIRFYVKDSEKPVTANIESVISTENCVILGNNENAKIILVEHFMAACAFAGIDSLDVHLDSPELPILDGSSIEWHKLLDKNNPPTEIISEKPLGISSGKTDIALIPADEFRISYCMNFDHPELKNRWTSFDLSQDKNQILAARTFGYLKDLEKFQKAGFALGVTKENIVGLAEIGYTVELRSKLEPIKHKILDLIGDLYLTGLNPLGFKAHIIAKEAGHKTHIEFAEQLKNNIKYSKEN